MPAESPSDPSTAKSPHNKFTYPFGFGIFHSGVEVYGTGNQFGHIQIYKSLPLAAMNRIKVAFFKFRQTPRFPVPHYARYNVDRNCNHFSNDFAIQISGRAIPKWVNRLANMGKMLPCLVVPESDWIPAAPNIPQN
ncbi:hypothetical protein PSACC_03671, partial [Paramicrosporidium saccamoebae]